MSQNLDALLTPFNIGKVQIKNRYCMGPMGTNMLFDSRYGFNDNGVEFFVERAKGGFGLLYTGVMLVDMEVDKFNPQTSHSPLANPTMFRRSATRLNERVDAYGSKMFAMLGMGAGRNYPTLYSSSENEVFRYKQFKSPALTVDQIKRKIEQIIQSAELMKKSGFAGVEMHALHWGYLLDQFAMAITNHREDEYGGCLENRLRVARELVEGIKQVCGSDYPVTMRLGLKSYIKGLNQASFDGSDEAGRTLEEGLEICRLLESYGYDALSVDEGVYDSFYYACPPCYVDKGHGLPLYAEAKKTVSIPILAGGRMGDPYLCAEALEKNQADAFVLSRPSLADPYLPRKIEQGEPEKIRPCIGCNQGCIYRLMERDLMPTCAVNPQAFRELTNRMRPAIVPKKVMVIGGGIAGMEAARTAKLCGHKVELYEKRDVLGGALLSAGAHTFKSEVRQLNDWYQAELHELKIPVHMKTEVTVDMVRDQKPDAIILAVGAAPVMPRSIKGIDHPKAVSCVSALEGHAEVGENVVIIGGGQVGCEIALDYAKEGKKVTIVEALGDIMKAGDTPPIQVDMFIRDAMKHYNVELLMNTRLMEVNDEGAVVQTPDGTEKTLACDNVVLALGFRSLPSMGAELRGLGAAIYEIGNGRRPSNILNSLGEAYEIANNL